MAVQQNKKSPSRRGMRRSHYGAAEPELSADPMSGDRHIRHHLARGSGFYRDRRIIQGADKDSDAEDAE